MARFLLASVASIVLWLAAHSPAAAQTMRAHFLDVGQGSAAILEFPCAAILVDTGGELNNEFDSTASLLDQIEDFFLSRPDLGSTFHSIVLTHPHIDHTRSVKAVLQRYHTRNAVTNGQEVSSGKPGQKALHKLVADSEQTGNPNDAIGFEPVRVQDMPAGQGFTSEVIDPVKCDTVDPKITALWGTAEKGPGWTKSDFENQNNHSVVLRVDFGQASMLLTGDLEQKGIAGLLARYQNTGLLDTDVYLVGHHGAANATTDPFLLRITPVIAVMSMGAPSRQANWTAWAYGHPRKVIVDLLAGRVQKTRVAKSVPVATGQRVFEAITVTKAIYATGWDGPITLEADTQGRWTVLNDQPAAPPAPVVGPATSTRVNINTASADELSTLPMIGLKRARDVVAFRTQQGPFPTIEAIMDVPGIGLGTFKAIRPLVRVN